LSDSLVTINNLSFKREERTIFKSINLQIPRGKITAVMGPSGTGKTTLLRLIGGQLTPDQGNIQFDGQVIHELSSKQLFKARRRMGLLFQSGALFTNMSVFDNVAFPLREHTDLSADMLRDLVLIKLEAVGLRGARDLMPSQLSGGMARRVALARTLALDPELLMYDEPFTGQDPITLGVLMQLVKRLNAALGLTSVIVSHDVAVVRDVADYIYVLSDGEVIGQGEPEKVLAEQEPRVHQFMHGDPDGPVPFHFPAKDFVEDLLT